MNAPHRLALDGTALRANWQALARVSGAACGAAVKADGYGLGAHAVVVRLLAAGCRDFFVSSWNEARALADIDLASAGATLSVLHGVRDEDMAAARELTARPVLNTPAQVKRWRDAGGRPCDVMVDTGMNRLGIAAADIAAGLLDGLAIDTLMSHLACADEASAMNERQRDHFAALSGRTCAKRMSLANSAGITLGADYHFDLTRPGLALYGGLPVAALGEAIRPVVRIEAEVLQRRTVAMGESVGYNATWIAPAETEVAIVNLGYADGYWRGFSDTGTAFAADVALPVIGRVSMDLVALDVSRADVAEGDWIAFDPDLPRAAVASGMSQYELITGLGHRFDRIWRD
ncbi:alanine racemase [Sphingomonas sp. HHU CXW]|uniref:alanine racemase n=1 Tax=Sphingomonas hominis TaxID=2741495 RepID=A0ABX2JHJ1_9SPHN|nr:alanine racemase [Sphingomonas hominis]NTS64920.1 alanine racemase [Sphingomonas hominis]